MTYAEEMNALALDERSRRKAEAKREAEIIFNNYKSSIRHFASLGEMSTSIVVPYEYKGEERDSISVALREVLVENGFKVSTIARDRYEISWNAIDRAI